MTHYFTMAKSSARYILFVALILTLIILAPGPATTQGILPAKLEVTILGKILSYDQNLQSRIQQGNTIHVAVLYIPSDSQSDQRANEVNRNVNTLGPRLVSGQKVNAFRVPYNDAASAKNAIDGKKATVVYIAPGLESNIGEITQYSRSNKILTVAAQPDYVHKGVSVGVFLENNKPQMLINLASSRKEGANFSSSLLKLSKVLR